VDFAPIKALAHELWVKAKEGLRTREAAQVIRQILQKDDLVPFGTAQAVRSDLLAVTRSGQEVIKGKAKALASRLSKAVDGAMETAAERLGGGAYEAWRTANAFWKEGAETFNDALVRRVANSDPDVVLDKMLLPRRPVAIRRVREMINDPQTWQQVQREFLEQTFERALGAREAIGPRPVPSGVAILRELKRFGAPMLGELFPDVAQRTALTRFANNLALIQAKPTGGESGRMAVQLMQPGAMIGFGASLLVGNVPGMVTGSAILTGPKGLAWAMSHPKIAQALTMGVNIPAGTPAATALIARITGLAADAGIPVQEAPSAP
jgi:hypothetical protein